MTALGGARGRLLLLALAVVVAIVVAAVCQRSSSGSGAATGTGGRYERAAYEGLGTWVDVFDYAPNYQNAGLSPTVTPADVDAMASLGVRTIFLQATRLDDRSPDGIVDARLIGGFLEQAHQHGLRVVGWYLPKFAELDDDLSRLRQIHEFEWNGHRFDGITVDIEDVEQVPDVTQRNARLVELSRRLRDELGRDVVIGAGVLPPVQIEVINPAYWPGFPWRDIAPYYDVWLPMAYWSVRRDDSGWKDGYRYVVESVRRLRDDIGVPDAAVHPIGGIADGITEADARDYLRGLSDTDAIGGSLYDYRTTTGGVWGVLRGLDGALGALPGPTTTVPTPTTAATTAPPAG